MEYRKEKDSLGIKEVPADAYYGVQTVRALENFAISGLKIDPIFIKVYGIIKKAAAMVNKECGILNAEKADIIIKAAEDVISGKLDDHIKVDAYQAGAGTSFHMNINEVIANRALELLGHPKGNYSFIHPNDDVNMSQSTNDTFPTAIRIATILYHKQLLKELFALLQALKNKSKEFKKVIKSGRTHLQDALPITLGQEFGAYAEIIATQIQHLQKAIIPIHYLGVGGTAVGTGVNSPLLYSRKMVKTLSMLSGIRFKKARNLIEKMQSMGDFTCYSAALRNHALELIKISNDLRLMNSGPRTGLAEIELPAMQPGSSIMPGKINPSLCEALNMICFQIVGNDLAIASASLSGQLELNVMMPLIAFNILFSQKILTNGIAMFTTKCIKGIKANIERCRFYFENSVSLVTLLSPKIGYEKAAELAKESKLTGKTFFTLLEEQNLLSPEELKKLTNLKFLTGQ